MKEDTDRVWWALSMLVDSNHRRSFRYRALIAGFDVYAEPKDEPAMLLSELPELLQSMGLSLWRDGSDYLENSYLAYELEPVEDPEADWRLDVYTGSLPPAGAHQRLPDRPQRYGGRVPQGRHRGGVPPATRIVGLYR